MRQPLTFSCQGATLAGTLHPAPGRIGVVIVSGGLQTRHGSHRGFVALADQLAEAGFPVLRFDRRGVGDSDGQDPGFRDSGADIAAAVAAFRSACPDVHDIVGWGLCDGGTALILDPRAFAGLILANPWTLDGDRPEPLPQSAAIAAHYAARVVSPRAWLRLIRGTVNLRALAGGIKKIVRANPISTTAASIISGLAAFHGETLILLAERDGTAQAFAALLRRHERAGFVRRTTVVTVVGATHTFPGADAEGRMIDACLDWLRCLDTSLVTRAI